MAGRSTRPHCPLYLFYHPEKSKKRKGNSAGDQRIGELCLDMLDMITPRCHRRDNGGIGDRRTVITEDPA